MENTFARKVFIQTMKTILTNTFEFMRSVGTAPKGDVDFRTFMRGFFMILPGGVSTDSREVTQCLRDYVCLQDYVSFRTGIGSFFVSNIEQKGGTLC